MLSLGQLTEDCQLTEDWQLTGGAPVAVDHSKQRTVAANAVDPIDWLLPPHSTQGSTP